MIATALVVLLAASSGTPPHEFTITAYGAKPDGTTDNRYAIGRAVAAAAAWASATGGGGSAGRFAHVVVPAGGSFLTGSISLATRVYLKLDTGALLLGSAAQDGYPAAGWNWDPALIDTHNASFTGVIGSGTIDGQVGPHWIDHYDPVNNFLVAVTWAGVHGCKGECRPKMLRFSDCNHVTVTGVTLQNSPDWTQLYRRCTHVLLQGLTVRGSVQWGNNDGVDFESGSNIRVLDSTFSTGDDGIVFASGNTNANKVPSLGLPLSDVVVDNCTIESKSSAIKFEAIDFGGCDHGPLENMVISNIVIRNSSRGIGFQQRNGHGDIRNISFSNLDIQTVYPTGTNWWGSGEPIWITNVGETRAEGARGKLGTIADISFTGVTAVAENGVLISGIGRAIGPITFTNFSLEIAVIGNATCRKGRPGAPSGCTDYRPGSGPEVVLGNTSGIRVEGTGAATLDGVTVRFRRPAARGGAGVGASTGDGAWPAYWNKLCVEHAVLPSSIDPHAQGFDLGGDPGCDLADVAVGGAV